MKKHIKSIGRFASALLLLACVALYSCKGLLDEEPFSKYDGEKYFENTKFLNMAVLGIYQVLQDSNLYGTYVWSAFDCDTDVSHVYGSGIGINKVRNLGKYYILPGDTPFDDAWRLYYKGINAANLILKNLDKVQISSPADEIYFKQLVAETKFLRGLIYFDLVKYFGDVPFSLTATSYGDNYKLPRTDKATVYAKVVEDMTEAAADLPWHDEIAYKGRATKSAAMGMLVRVNMYRAGYSLYQDREIKRVPEYKDYFKQAVDWADLLIESGKHELNPDYGQIFKNHCQYVLEPKESIFEIENHFLDGAYKNSSMGTYNCLSTARSDKYMNVNRFIMTHALPYLKFEAADLRRDFSIARFSLDDKGEQKPIADKESPNWGIRKWSREWQTADQFKSNASTGINTVILRYADVLLMKAEALIEIADSPTDEAYELVNQVRRRGYGKPINTPDPTVDMNKTTVNTHEAFLKYIQDERVRELAFESALRRQDLIRWNILQEAVLSLQTLSEGGKYARVNYDWTAAKLYTKNKHELYPIPAREMRENKSLTQNPGYAD